MSVYRTGACGSLGTAYDPGECLSLPHDLVLMDCQMPELDGYDATAEIRRRLPRRIPYNSLEVSFSRAKSFVRTL